MDSVFPLIEAVINNQIKIIIKLEFEYYVVTVYFLIKEITQIEFSVVKNWFYLKSFCNIYNYLKYSNIIHDFQNI